MTDRETLDELAGASRALIVALIADQHPTPQHIRRKIDAVLLRLHLSAGTLDTLQVEHLGAEVVKEKRRLLGLPETEGAS